MTRRLKQNVLFAVPSLMVGVKGVADIIAAGDAKPWEELPEVAQALEAIAKLRTEEYENFMEQNGIDAFVFRYDYEMATMLYQPPALVPPLLGEVFEYTPVPEPATAPALMLFGLGILGFKLKRRHVIKNRT